MSVPSTQLRLGLAVLASGLTHIAVGSWRPQPPLPLPAARALREVMSLELHLAAAPGQRAELVQEVSIARPRSQPRRGRPRSGAPVQGTGASHAPRELAVAPPPEGGGGPEGGALSGESPGAARDVQPVRRAPSPVLGNPTPAYPPAARRAGIEGYVLVRLYLLADGRVERLEILEGNEIFYEDVERTLAGWRFHPAITDGRPVPTRWTVRIPFELR